MTERGQDLVPKTDILKRIQNGEKNLLIQEGVITADLGQEVEIADPGDTGQETGLSTDAEALALVVAAMILIRMSQQSNLLLEKKATRWLTNQKII